MVRLIWFLLLIVFGACKSPETLESGKDSRKIITAGGTLTEVVYNLGFGDEIIATDITSTYPVSMQSLPSIGYRNQIKAEGILALGPDLVLIEDGYLSADVVEQLKNAKIEIQVFAKPKQVSDTKKLVTELAEFFDAPDMGKEINSAIDKDIEELNEYLASQNKMPKAVFVMARGPETVFIAGDKTFASEMFNLAKVETVATGFDEFVPLTPESLVKMNPDYLIFFESGIQSLGGKEGLVKIQGIEQTTAFKQNQIVALDGQFLSGFGPRVGKAALELAKAVRN